jgi:hypothetical protein
MAQTEAMEEAVEDSSINYLLDWTERGNSSAKS